MSAADATSPQALVHHTVQVPATSANLGAGFDAFGLALFKRLLIKIKIKLMDQ